MKGRVCLKFKTLIYNELMNDYIQKTSSPTQATTINKNNI